MNLIEIMSTSMESFYSIRNMGWVDLSLRMDHTLMGSTRMDI